VSYFPDDIFYGSIGPHDADIMIIGESWGATENAKKLAFQGESGKKEMRERLLPECNIDPDECYMTNVIPAHPGGNDMQQFFYRTKQARTEGSLQLRGLFPKPILAESLDRLRQQILAVKPKIIIGFGNYCLWALTEDCFSIGDENGYKIPTGIISWRGSQLYTSSEMGGTPYLPTIHPAAYLRNWAWRYQVKHDIRQRLPAVYDNWRGPNYQFLVRPSFEEAVHCLEGLVESLHNGLITKLAADIETRRRHIACISIAWDNVSAICIPLMVTAEPHHYWSEEQELVVIGLLAQVLGHPKAEVVGQNFLYDDQYIALYWMFFCRVKNDTMIKHHVCWPGTPRGLHYLSSMYCDYHRYWKDESKNWNPKVGEEQLWVYCCKDSVTTYEVDTELGVLIDELNLRPQYEFQMRQWYMIRDMMNRGVLINQQRRVDAAFELGAELAKHDEYLERLIPPDVWPRDPKKSPWPSSPKQMMAIFYDILDQKEIKLRGKRTTNDTALEIIGKREPLLEPITTALRERRSLGVFVSTFTQAKLDPDGRMRSSWDPSGTETYRWNSRKNAFDRGANLQNIPKGVDLDG
jgi:uracil-DNA glycosylase